MVFEPVLPSDTYRVDRCVLPLREQRLAGALYVHARKTGAGHLLPRSNIVLYYVPCIYVSTHMVKSSLMQAPLAYDKGGLSNVRTEKWPPAAGNGTEYRFAARFQASWSWTSSPGVRTW
ncbi:hypothetical protein QFZ89_008398 [Paraburkholderia youngii]